MRMRNLAPLPVFLALGVSSLVATALVPRKSPELKFVGPSGKEALLSSFKGKVVVIEFLLTDCPRCLRVAQTINKLHSELAPRGFQPIGIAFDNGINGPVVTNFVQYFKVTYPVGYTSSDKVDSYLGRSAMERLRVPQIVVIDRAGVIRAQSRPAGESNLEDENYLRHLIDTLLRERAPTGNTKKTASPPKKTS
jgi:thiol-disulfide isomerase/thioredoxin